ncbi:MAG: hypothetical protein R3B72_46995 [Polyangiaceae bacterium]
MASFDGSAAYETRREEKAPGTTLRGVVRGESVAAIAFVEPDLPACRDRELGQALELLAYGAASARPASCYDDERAFAAALAVGDHRGAIALVEPELWLDEGGGPAAVSYRVLEPRLGVGFVGLGGGEVVENHGPAVDPSRAAVEFLDDEVIIDHWQRFGLAHAGELDGRLRRGGKAAASPPFGWLRLRYRLGSDGSGRCELACSYLPTVWFYRDWQRVHRSEARRASEVEVERVLDPQRDVASGTTTSVTDVGAGVVRRIA